MGKDNVMWYDVSCHLSEVTLLLKQKQPVSSCICPTNLGGQYSMVTVKCGRIGALSLYVLVCIALGVSVCACVCGREKERESCFCFGAVFLALHLICRHLKLVHTEQRHNCPHAYPHRA